MATSKRRKRKLPRTQVRMQEYELSYVLALPQAASFDDFLDKLVELVEGMGGYLGGSAMPYVESKNGKKEKRRQRPANRA